MSQFGSGSQSEVDLGSKEHAIDRRSGPYHFSVSSARQLAGDVTAVPSVGAAASLWEQRVSRLQLVHSVYVFVRCAAH